MESRFSRYKANLRSYLRKRGAEIDVRRKTIKVDVDSLSWKELNRLRELEKYGYRVNEGKNPPPPTNRAVEEFEFEDDSFISFADEIILMYHQ